MSKSHYSYQCRSLLPFCYFLRGLYEPSLLLVSNSGDRKAARLIVTKETPWKCCAKIEKMKIKERSLTSFVLAGFLAIFTTTVLQFTIFEGAILLNVNFLLLGGAFLVNIWAIFHYISHRNAGIACIQVSYYNAFGMILPGIIYLSVGLLPWVAGFRIYSDNLMFQTSALLLLASFALHLGIIRGLTFSGNQKTEIARYSEKRIFWVLVILFLLCLCAFAWIGPSIITMPRIELSSKVEEGRNTFGVFKRVSLVLFAVGLVAGYFARHSEHRQNRRVFMVLFILSAATLLIFVNPLNSARWRVMGFIVSFALIFFSFNSPKLKTTFFLLLLFGTIVVYPLIGVFSRSADQWNTLTAGQWQAFFAAGDFDGVQNVLQGIYYVQVEGVSWGFGMVSSIFAFVPPQIWVDKPVHSGRLAAELVGTINPNLAMPLPGEAFMNFGWFGIGFMYVVGRWIAAIDRNIRVASIPNFSFFVSVVIAGSALFVSRGALMSAMEFIGIIMISIMGIMLVGSRYTQHS